jgi:hypothetical protein
MKSEFEFFNRARALAGAPAITGGLISECWLAGGVVRDQVYGVALRSGISTTPKWPVQYLPAATIDGPTHPSVLTIAAIN